MSVTGVLLQPKGKTGSRAAIEPVRERPFQLTVGHLPAHGIIDEARWRHREWIFDRLPDGEFDVVVETSAGRLRGDLAVCGSEVRPPRAWLLGCRVLCAGQLSAR